MERIKEIQSRIESTHEDAHEYAGDGRDQRERGDDEGCEGKQHAGSVGLEFRYFGPQVGKSRVDVSPQVRQSRVDVSPQVGHCRVDVSPQISHCRVGVCPQLRVAGFKAFDGHQVVPGLTDFSHDGLRLSALKARCLEVARGTQCIESCFGHGHFSGRCFQSGSLRIAMLPGPRGR